MIQDMKILRFGSTGRIAKITQRAFEALFLKPDIYTYQRNGGYLHELTNTFYSNLEKCSTSWGSSKIVFVDTSIDHSNINSLIEHENLKHKVILWLAEKKILYKAIGFSSGITLIDKNSISPIADQMLAYREKKIIQEDYFSSLDCQFYLPNIFTLIGPATYSRQAAAWAQVLSARLKSATNFKINEPYSKRLWVSEKFLFISLLHFLRNQSNSNVTGPLVQGSFTLDQIANIDLEICIPPLKYLNNKKNGWLLGDYTTENLHDSTLTGSINSVLFESMYH